MTCISVLLYVKGQCVREMLYHERNVSLYIVIIGLWDLV